MTSAETFYWRTRALLVPNLENSQCAYVERLRRALAQPRRWLDIGCGHAIVQPWLAKRVAPITTTAHHAVGLDLDRDALVRHDAFTHRVEGSGQQLPFRDQSFELLSANMVLEHVAEPDAVFAEAARVLKPGGAFLVHTPNQRGYTTRLTHVVPARLRSRLVNLLQGRAVDDVYPTFYRANDLETLKALGTRHGLNMCQFEYVQSSPQFMMVPPLVVFELLLIRLLERRRFQGLRPCLIVMFKKV